MQRQRGDQIPHGCLVASCAQPAVRAGAPVATSARSRCCPGKPTARTRTRA